MSGVDGPGDGGDFDAIEDPSDYKQQRRIQSILDARDRVLEQRRKALDREHDGRINRFTARTVVRNAVEDYILESETRLRQSRWAGHYWQGRPFVFVDDDDDDEEIAADAADDNDVDLDVDPVRFPRSELEELETAKRQLAEQMTRPLLLGSVPMPEVGDNGTVRHILGLRLFMATDDPIQRQVSDVTDHPETVRETDERTVRYQFPIELSMQAYRTVNEFWALMEMDVEMGQEQPHDTI